MEKHDVTFSHTIWHIIWLLQFVHIDILKQMTKNGMKMAMWRNPWPIWKHLIEHMGSEPMSEEFRGVFVPIRPQLGREMQTLADLWMQKTITVNRKSANKATVRLGFQTHIGSEPSPEKVLLVAQESSLNWWGPHHQIVGRWDPWQQTKDCPEHPATSNFVSFVEFRQVNHN